MPAKWTRVSPAVLAATTPIKGGTMIMATAAKKHLTVFVRNRRAPGAGRSDVKAAFTSAAHGTLGIPARAERNVKIQEAILRAGLKTGVYHKKSRARPGSPLYGKVYTLGGAK
ncbi:MAG: hypothetical protein QXI36_02050 [Candidatus Bathyarchaeia archaeon]